MSPAERFWAKVTFTDYCWEWSGASQDGGYGRFWDGERVDGTHRFAWRLTFGSIPEGLLILHHCDNPCCVRPQHLFLGTDADNHRDKSNKRRAPAGANNPASRLTVIEVRMIREAYAAGGVSQRSLAATYGVQAMTINKIVNRRTWQEVA